MTQEKNEIRVSSKLCERIEDGFRDGWLIDLPKESKYAGYQMYVSGYYIDTSYHRRYLRINKGNKNFTYELYKKEREPGKRYPRYKLTFEELLEVFSEHSAQFGIPNNLPYVLAYCKDYANDGTRSAGRVLGYYYCVGRVDKAWLYEEFGQQEVWRRRLGTRGVKILKNLTLEEVEPIRQMLHRRNELQERIDEIKDCRINIGEFEYTRWKKHLSETAFAEVQKRLNEIDAIIDIEVKSDEDELAKIEEYLTSLTEVNN